MIYKNKKAAIFIYILLLINIALIIGYIVFNNIFILNNNLNIGKNAEEVFSNVYDKGNINIESVQKYNSNGSGFIDVISCPTNITMSGSTASGTAIVSQMVYNLGSIYCQGFYNSDEFRIFFDNDYLDFDSAYYTGDLVNIIKSIDTNIYLGTTNIALDSTVTGSAPWNGNLAIYSADNNTNTHFDSYYRNTEWLKYEFSSDKSIGHITIKKPLLSGWYWNNATVYLYDSSGVELDYITITGASSSTQIDLDLSYRGLTADIRSIKIVTNNRYLYIDEFEIYELFSDGSEEMWKGDRNFNDTDSTLISFTSDGIGGLDLIDDNFNSDNYRVTSIDWNYYANNFQDDDVIPRLMIFGNVKSNDIYYNIFWSNYKTNDFINNNLNNNDNLNIKIGEVDNGYMYLNLFSDLAIKYDLKILEFDRLAYKDEFTLLPLSSIEGINLSSEFGYLQNNSGSLKLSSAINGNEYIFDFKNKDYALFMINKGEGNLAYRLSAETSTGTQIYINPIDDSGTGTIKSLSNHVIIGGEKNFIGEDFVIVGKK